MIDLVSLHPVDKKTKARDDQKSTSTSTFMKRRKGAHLDHSASHQMFSTPPVMMKVMTMMNPRKY